MTHRWQYAIHPASQVPIPRRGKGAPRAPGNNNGGQQHTKFAEHADGHRLHREGFGAELLELLDALVGDHHTDQEAEDADDRQRLDPHLEHLTNDGIEPEAARLQIVRRMEVERAPALVDGDKIKQVFWNLLANAVKFTPEGGHVRLSVHPAPEGVVATVRDTGIGIEPAFLPHIFDRFQQADLSNTRRHGGLGLGLSIAKQKKEAMAAQQGMAGMQPMPKVVDQEIAQIAPRAMPMPRPQIATHFLKNSSPCGI